LTAIGIIFRDSVQHHRGPDLTNMEQQVTEWFNLVYGLLIFSGRKMLWKIEVSSVVFVFPLMLYCYYPLSYPVIAPLSW